jgi:xylulokinase
METRADSKDLKYVLAIDLGTGGPKAGVVDQNGNVVGSGTGVTPIYFLPNNGAEQDPHEWWGTSVAASRQAIKQAGVPKESIIAVSVTGQWGLIVPVDKNGEPLMRAVHWADTRGEPYTKKVVSGFPMVEGYGLAKMLRWINLAGIPPMIQGGSMGHMLFIKNELPEIYEKTYKFLEPMDYINLRLTGRAVAPMCTILTYFMTDNRDLDSTDYHPWMVKVSGIDKEKLPEIVPVDSVIGTLTPAAAEELGLNPDTKVVASSSDNSTSAVGSGAIAEGRVAAVLGTSGYLSAHYSKKKSDLSHFIISAASAFRGMYLMIAETGNTCKVLDSFLRNQVYQSDPNESGPLEAEKYQEINEIAAQVKAGSNGVLFMPWYLGAMAPQGDSLVKGGFLNLTNRSSQADMIRAVLEGISFNWRWLRDPAEKFLENKSPFWLLTGGGALLPTWCQIMADVVGIPMHQQAEPRNNNVIGAAFLAFHRLGMISLEDIPQKVKIGQIFEPQEANKAIYDEMFEQYQAAFKQLKPVYHQLNK